MTCDVHALSPPVSGYFHTSMTNVASLNVPRLSNTPTTVGPDYLLAAIDIGTNSIHMAIVRVHPELPSFSIVTREKETVRLGDRDLTTGKLKPEIIQRSVDALRRCQAIAQSLHVDEIIAVATSATREAPNGHEFIARVRDELNLEVSVISGQEEARQIYLGVLSGMELSQKPHAIIDIGGGSTELILGDGQEARSLSSTKIGAVRLTQEFITTDPIDDREFSVLQAYIHGVIERPAEELISKLKTGETLRLVGTSGTVSSIATLIAIEETGQEPTILNGFCFSRDALAQWVDRLRQADYATRLAIPGMQERRAEILLAGALVLLTVMQKLDIQTITVCERALREGVIVDWMLKHGLIEDKLRYQSSVSERSVLKLAKKFDVDLDYSDRVAQFALQLFEQTQGVLHDATDRDRQLFWVATILHNCGLYVSHSAHHKHSYYLIRHGELLGYTELEIAFIANLARYHRKSAPKKKHLEYANLPPEQRQLVRQLSPLLRLAIAIDRRQIGAIASMRCECRPGQLQLYLKPRDHHDPCELERWSIDQKKVIFEQEYNVQLIATLVRT